MVDSPHSGSAPDSRTGRVRIVGRDRELSLLRDVATSTLAGHGRLVIVSGEAGIGKSTLLGEIARDAAERGALTLSGACYDLTTTPPYGPWIELLDDAPDDHDEALSRVLRMLRQSAGDDREDVSSQSGLFEMVRSLLEAVGSRQPALLALEDMHWSDLASLELLRFLARHLASIPVSILVTYRPDDLTRHHPLFQLLPLLARESQAERIELRRLPQDTVHSLVASRYALAPADTARLTGFLHSRADGNPLFTIELLRTLEDERVLTHAGDFWELADLSRTPTPRLVEQIIERRLSDLQTETRGLLDLGAVIGHTIPFDLWQQLAGADDDTFLTGIESALEARLIVTQDSGDSARFASPLVRQVLYQRILPPRRRAWHRHTAEALSRLPHPDPDAVAYHFEQCADERAIDWLVLAGERAQRGYAWTTAVSRFESAVQLMERSPGTARDRGWLMYRAGRLMRFDDSARGIEFLAEAERLGRAVNDHVLASIALADQGLLRCIALDVGQGLGDMAEGLAALDALVSSGEGQITRTVNLWIADSLAREATAPGDECDDPVEAPVIIPRSGSYALWLAWAGRLRDAMAIAEETLRRIPSPGVAAEALDDYGDSCNALGTIYAALGRPDDARRMFALAREAYRAIDHHMLVGVTATHELRDVLLVYDTTNVTARQRVAQDAVAAFQRTAGAGSTMTNSDRLGELSLLMLEGRWDEAHDVVTELENATGFSTRHLIGATSAALARLRGDPEAAWRRVLAGLPAGPRTPPGGTFVTGHGSALQQLAVELSLDSGNLPVAHEWLEAHDRWIDWTGGIVHDTERAALWARYHRASGESAAARERAEQALQRAIELQQPRAQLTAHRLLAELDIDARRFDDAAAHLDAALSLADACAAPFERAQSLVTLARLRGEVGQIEQARSALDEADAIAQSLGAAPLLRETETLRARLESAKPASAYPAGLTAREVEVLRLVAQGLTDAEVAEQLFLARRTVNSHLTSIYTKLNVSSRAGATRFAVENGLA